MLAGSIDAGAGEHQAVIVDWWHATRIAGIRYASTSSPTGDESRA
jgi:hypothetical protein